MAMYAVLHSSCDDLRRESEFEHTLATLSDRPFERVFQDLHAWGVYICVLTATYPKLILLCFSFAELPLRQRQAAIRKTFQLDAERKASPYPEDLLAAIKGARRDKIANKTLERTRERRGEVLSCTLHRRRRTPPAHVLRMMTPERRQMDRIVRSVSEVGYVGLIKRRLGFKLKTPHIE